jgi:hypothetical protein
MNICIDSEFVQLETDIKTNIINTKRKKHIDKLLEFVSNGLPENAVIHSTNFYIEDYTYSEQSLPLKIYIPNLTESITLQLLKWIGINWSEYAICKTIIANKEYTINVDGIKFIALISYNVQTPIIKPFPNTESKKLIKFTNTIYQLKDICKRLYEPYPEFWEENIKFYKKLTESYKYDTKDVSDRSNSEHIYSQLTSHIINNLKNIDLGIVLSKDMTFISEFGLSFIQHEHNIQSNIDKLYLLTITFLDLKQITKKISIYTKHIKHDLLLSSDVYILDLNDGTTYEIAKIYNNPSFEPIHYIENRVFGAVMLYIAIVQYIEILDNKFYSSNYKEHKQQQLYKLLTTNDDMKSFCESPVYILRFAIMGVYKDLKIETRKLISNEYKFGEKKATTYFEIK